jgi:hypothetical protein
LFGKYIKEEKIKIKKERKTKMNTIEDAKKVALIFKYLKAKLSLDSGVKIDIEEINFDSTKLPTDLSAKIFIGFNVKDLPLLYIEVGWLTKHEYVRWTLIMSEHAIAIAIVISCDEETKNPPKVTSETGKCSLEFLRKEILVAIYGYVTGHNVEDLVPMFNSLRNLLYSENVNN